jgi:hypothetical protein
MKPLVFSSILLLTFFSSCKKELMTSPFNTVLSSNESKLLTDSIYPGASYQGGIIFWIDSTEEHGLIAAPLDYEENATWRNFFIGYTLTGAARKQIGKGRINTRNIITNSKGDEHFENTYHYAANVCWKAVINGYDDWYLPSLNELIEMNKLKNVIGGFADAAYWSSTEQDLNNAWRVTFGETTYISWGDKAFSHKVRAIRAF